MNDAERIEQYWYFLYNNILLGRVSMIISLGILAVAVFIFIRWKMFGVSLLFLTIALIVAYAGGIVKMIEGVM